MSDTVLIALIGTVGPSITALATIGVAIIQTRKLRDERDTAREDRDIAAKTVRTLEIEAEAQSAQCTASSPCCSHTSGAMPETGSAALSGEPT